jgi:hypothetical protein
MRASASVAVITVTGTAMVDATANPARAKTPRREIISVYFFRHQSLLMFVTRASSLSCAVDAPFRYYAQV